MSSDIRHWIMLCEADHDGDAYFELNDLRDVHNYKSRETLIYMSPTDFVAMVEPEYSDDKDAGVASLLRKGVKFNSTPMLKFIHNGKGLAKVVGHEGRHRARALRALGVQEIPVVFLSLSGAEGPAIRWGSQDNEFDRVPMMPTQLQSEDGQTTIPFPKSVIF